MNTSTRLAANSTNRLATIRRLYFYLVALISLIVTIAGLDSLTSLLCDVWLADETLRALQDGDYIRRNIAQNGGLLLVATPIFLLHWNFMQRRLDEPGERGAGIRKLFLYLASAFAVGYALAYSYSLLHGVARLAFGEPLTSNALWPSEWLHTLLMIGVGIGLEAYFHRVLISDGDYGQEEGLAGSWRRWYQALTGLAGLGFLIQGGSDILGAAWQAARSLPGEATTGLGAQWWSYQLSDGLTQALIGAIIVRINWQRWRTITERSVTEATSALRRLYLYVAVIISALATLIPAVILLQSILLILLGSPSITWAELPDRLSSSLPYLPIGLAAWIWYWRFLRQEAQAAGESREGATVRRLYYYTVAATGLSLVWIGAVNTLQAFFDRLLVTTSPSDGFWVDLLAVGLSLLAVGAPVWSMHWRTAQNLARQTTVAGAQERSSLPRRIYLYGVALAGALFILFYLAQVVYRLLLLLLGDPTADLFSAETANELARSVIAAVLWIVHVLAIRGDGQLGGEEHTTSEEMTIHSREDLLARIAQLEQELKDAKTALAALDQPAQSPDSTFPLRPTQ